MFQVQALSFMKNQFRMLTSVVLLILISVLSVLPVYAESPQNTINASASLAYNLK